MQITRRIAATLFVAALVSAASASSALATTDTSIPNLSSLSGTQLFPDETYVFARGSDNSLLMNRRVRDAWSGVASLGGGVVGSPTTVQNFGSAWTFVRGTDDQVYFTRVTKGLASGFQVVPGLLVNSRVSAISYGGRITIFARGRDGAGYANTFIPPSDLYIRQPGWTGWQNLGGALTSDISAVQFDGSNQPQGSINIFARGVDNAVYVNTSGDPARGNWSGWRRLGGAVTSNITPVLLGTAPASTDDPDGEGALFIFARGVDNALYFNRLGGNFVWSGWRGAGGFLTSDIAAFEFNGKITVVVRGTPDGLFANTIDADGRAAGYVALGGGIASNPVAIGSEVYVRGVDNALYVNRQNPDGRFTGYSRLGGQLG
jgi:hypothetical protein